jgi:N-acetylglucosamine-6-phosphate deacetylase
MDLFFHNLTLLTPNRLIDFGDLLVQGSAIRAIGPSGSLHPPTNCTHIDGSGLILSPGFIDLQINGGFGYDFTTDPHSIWAVARELPRYGVTAFLPTLVSSPPERIDCALEVFLQGAPANFSGARPLGWHLEGPFLNPRKHGAHDPGYLRLPEANLTQNWSVKNGVRLVTIAPELPGALLLIRTLTSRGIAVSAGHSCASITEAQAGFEAGIRYVTHLFNAMTPLHQRQPGLAVAALNEACIHIGLIADGAHVHPELIRMVWKLAPTRLNLVTDAMAALGKPPGVYPLAGKQVLVTESPPRMENGQLAGSLLSLDSAVKNLIHFTGCSLSQALKTVTGIPTRILGLRKQFGKLAPGYPADLVLLTPDLEIIATFVGGAPVYFHPHYQERTHAG